ncbi:hypothetical protein [Novosphingobium sp.]|uniref:hypothetical protein n=1 Tax=Novosphingobium sp. TaxID=1874826 RepID=UPI003D6C716A
MNMQPDRHAAFRIEIERANGHADTWAQLWRSAPADARHDVIYLACLFPALALIFLTLWIMLPA